jgi:hypothetical protein
MSDTQYLDLPEFGIRFVPFEDHRFPTLLKEILEPLQPMPAPDIRDLRNAAVLLNQSGKAIVVLAIVWRYKDVDGHIRTSRLSNLGSSTQMEILSGRLRADEDLNASILAGSKRLVTERGLFGTNLDVLPPAQQRSIGGRGGFGVAGRRELGHQIDSTDVSVDFAILEDGLCIGPDTGDMFASLSKSIELQRTTAETAARALRSGASEGQVFELLLPLARLASPGADDIYSKTLLPMFSHMAINELVNATQSEQAAWFERFAELPTLTLRKPT